MHSIIILFLIKVSSRNARDNEENVEVNGDSYYFLFEITLRNVLSNVSYSPTHRQAGTPMINIQSTLRTAPDLCKNISLAVLFGRNDNSYTISMQSDMCRCTRILQ
jgi:hypothetical protein